MSISDPFLMQHHSSAIQYIPLMTLILTIIDFVDRFLTCFTVALAAARAFPDFYVLSDPLCLALYAALASQPLYSFPEADPADGLKNDDGTSGKPQELSHIKSLDHDQGGTNERQQGPHPREHQGEESAIPSPNLGEQRDKNQSMESKLQQPRLSELTNLQDEIARAEGEESSETNRTRDEHMMRSRRLSFDDFEKEFWGRRLYLLRD